MDLHKLVEAASKSLKIAIPSILLGVVVTYLIFDALVLAGKNSEIANLNAVVEIEKGNQHVLNERLKLLGDKASFLDARLTYKTEIQKEEEAELAKKLSKLEEENSYLHNIKSELEKKKGEKLNLVQMKVELDKYIKENLELNKQLSKFQNTVIVKDYLVGQGQSWSEFGGQATFGLVSLDYDGDGDSARVKSTIFNGDVKVVKAGDQFIFSISNTKYILVVNTVQYVGSFIRISVYKQI